MRKQVRKQVKLLSQKEQKFGEIIKEPRSGRQVK